MSYHDGQQIYVHTENEEGTVRKGEVLVVNHDRHPTHVWALRDGKGLVVQRSLTRAATPKDAGYRLTREQWEAAMQRQIARYGHRTNAAILMLVIASVAVIAAGVYSAL